MPAQALLVLEDNDGYNALCHEAAATTGFTVFSAPSADAAMELCATNGPFDLLVADFTLGDGNGRKDILTRLRVLCPSMRALLMSASSLDQLLAAEVLRPEEFHPHRTVFLRKPQPLPVIAGKLLGLFLADTTMPLRIEMTFAPPQFNGSGSRNETGLRAAGAA